MINHASAYAQWREQLLQLPVAEQAATGTIMLQRALIDLLASDQFYGEVLLRLPRQVAVQLTTPLALTWQANRLTLQFAPQQLAQTFTRFDELEAGLKHVALHVIWQHPLRYRQQVRSQGELVRLATDLAVNQYVTGLPANSPQLATVQPMVAQPLPRYADSQVYLRLLQQQSQSQSASQSGPTAGNGQHLTTGSQPTTMIDNPDQWSADVGQISNSNLAQARLQQLVQTAWNQTPTAARGTVPGRVQAALKRLRQPAVVDWRQLLARRLGQMPAGRRPSRARFNRRQPARMELPGQVSDYRLQIQVYVDHSGSISDQTLQQLLGQVATLTQVMTVTITVQAFDAKVHTGQRYQVTDPQQIQFKRTGGGGTVYQRVFDDLQQRHMTNQQTIALILTDGQGETTVDSHDFTNVIWLLATPQAKLSVQPVIGQVVPLTLGDDVDD